MKRVAHTGSTHRTGTATGRTNLANGLGAARDAGARGTRTRGRLLTKDIHEGDTGVTTRRDARSDELDDALVPLEYLPGLFGVGRRTIELWMRADNIDTHPYTALKNSGMRHGRAVRWGDIPEPSSDTTRWKRRV